jgi:hypothetical protein
MDAKNLVVGQHVDMSSGCYGNEGEVIAVTPEGVDVRGMYGVILHFDKEGVGRPGTSTFECGLWYINGTPAHAEQLAKYPLVEPTVFRPVEEAMSRGLRAQEQHPVEEAKRYRDARGPAK